MSDTPLPHAASARYGLLGLPLAFVAVPLYVVLPQHYGQTLGVPLSLLGAILLLTRLGDALIDPWLGGWVDRLLRRPARARCRPPAPLTCPAARSHLCACPMCAPINALAQVGGYWFGQYSAEVSRGLNALVTTEYYTADWSVQTTRRFRAGPSLQYLPMQRLELRFDLLGSRSTGGSSLEPDSLTLQSQVHVWL